MIRSIERLTRRLSIASVMPFAIFIGGVHHPTDPMRKSGGPGTTTSSPTRYAGVLPVPSSSAMVSSSPNRLDSLLDAHRDARAERGRVLYAHGSEHKAAPAKPHRRQCADHVASARSGGPTPHS